MMTRRQTLKGALIAATMAMAMGGLPTAEATTFYYDSYGGFIAGSAFPGGGTFANDPDTATGGGAFDVGADADPRTAAGRYTDVSWGTPDTALGPYGGQSGMALTKVNDGAVTVNGGEAMFGKLTHFNRPIQLNTDIGYVDMDWSLQLFGTLADAAANTGAFRTIDLNYRVYVWETINDPASNPVYTVSYDNGGTWTTVGPGVCPGSTPEGTLIVGPAGKIFKSAYTDQPGYAPWNGECSDGHIFEAHSSNTNTFSHEGRDYRIDLVGFYGPLGILTETFWACENRDCFGTVNLKITDVTPPPPIPTVSQWGLILMSLLLAALGWAALRRARAA